MVNRYRERSQRTIIIMATTGTTTYVDLIAAAGDADAVVALMNDLLADLAHQGTLPQVPALGRDISVREMKDAYYWLGMLMSDIQRHACTIAPGALLCIHATLDTAFQRFEELGIR